VPFFFFLPAVSYRINASHETRLATSVIQFSSCANFKSNGTRGRPFVLAIKERMPARRAAR